MLGLESAVPSKMLDLDQKGPYFAVRGKQLDFWQAISQYRTIWNDESVLYTVSISQHLYFSG